MKQTYESCDHSFLLKLLEDPDILVDQRAQEHLANCEHCRGSLERLAASPEKWQTAKESLASRELDGEAYQKYRSSTSFQQTRTNPNAWSESMAKQMLAPPSHPELLGRLGRYEVERVIGSGGMGIVFKAHDTELNRPIAVKMLAPHLAGNDAARVRFAREARAAAAIVHEHVVPIYNVETESDVPYLVMHFVAGESLQQRIDSNGALELCEILRIALQTAGGLAAAHAQGLVHRDVKPSNILLEKGIERTLLTDFGLARASHDATLTHTGYHPGTPQYMSPEQARGEDIDSRSDLFSLGSVIYAMCTGRPPFRADTSYGILRKITDTQPISIRELNPSIPYWLALVVAKLHAKEPSMRFTTASEVRDVLEQCLAHVQQPSTAPLPSFLTDTIEARRPNKKLAGLVLASTLLLFISIVGMIIFPKMKPWNLQSKPPTERTTEEGVKSPSSEEQPAWEAWDKASRESKQFDEGLRELEQRVNSHWDQP